MLPSFVHVRSQTSKSQVVVICRSFDSETTSKGKCWPRLLKPGLDDVRTVSVLPVWKCEHTKYCCGGHSYTNRQVY